MKKQELKQLIREVIDEVSKSPRWRWTGTLGRPNDNIYLYDGNRIVLFCYDGVQDARDAKTIVDALNNFKNKTRNAH